jgi:hypothetical protein
MSTLDVQLSFSRATSLIGGATGGLPYQAATSSTVFAPIGANGFVLTSNGTTATWSAVAGGAGSVQTVTRSTDATHYLTFVDSDNGSATTESIYTNSKVAVNPATGAIAIGSNVFYNGLLSINGTVGTTTTSVILMGGRNSGGASQARIVMDHAASNYAGIGTGDLGGFIFGLTNNTYPYAISSTWLRLYPSGQVTIPTNIAATSVSTGSLVVTGGVGIGEKLFVNSDIVMNGAVGGGGNNLILRGGTGTGNEGPQIVMGYGNNTSSAISGQANNSWNIDVASGTANNNLRVFRQNNGGATVVAWEVEEQTGGSRFWGIGVGTTASNTQGELRASNEITAYFSSDIRLKENIQVIEDPITIVNQIRGVRFDWTEEHIARRGGEDGFFVRKHDIGVIAQEIEAVLPELVATRDDGYKAVKYEKIVPLLIEVVKAQQLQINQIREELNKLASK